MKRIVSYLVVSFLILSGVMGASSIDVQAASTKTKYVTASTLNVRSGPSTKHKVVTTFRKNQKVKVTQTKGAWNKVAVGKKKGWVSGKYLTTKKPTVKKKTVKKKTTKSKIKTKTMYVTASALNVRSGPSTKYKVVTTVKKDKAVKVTATKGYWKKVIIGKKKGWTSGKYLTTKKPVASKNLAAGLKTVAKNKQLILVTANGYHTSSAQIRAFEKNSKGKWVTTLTAKGYIGKYGFATPTKMNESAMRAPTGKYTIGTAFGRYKNPGTKLKYRKITSDSVWVDDPKSKLYNTWQSRKKTHKQWKSAEKMNIPAYNYGFVINYNTKRVPNKGSAIFFHVSNMYTYGCTGTSQANVLKILKWLDPKKKPVIIQTPIKELSKY